MWGGNTTFWTNTFYNLGKCIFTSGQIYFEISLKLDKYILKLDKYVLQFGKCIFKFGQIYFAMCTNVFVNLEEKNILHFGQIYFENLNWERN